MIVIATHAVFLNGKDVYGPPHAVSLFLNQKKIEHLFIKHDLYGKLPTLVEHYSKGKLDAVESTTIQANNILLRYFKEMIFNFQICRKFSPLDLYLGVDPLNSAISPFLKLSGVSKYCIFFCADFAITRFDSPLMNTIYHLLDSFCMYLNDQTWSISKRVFEFRQKKGLKPSKNKLVPNAPFYDSIYRDSKKVQNRFDFVLVSALEKGIDFKILFEAFKIVHKEFSKTKLYLIGSGSLQKNLLRSVNNLKLNSSIKFLGAMTHDQMFKKITTCGVGIALYSDSDPNHFRYFSDPMKVRDYLASGLPVLVSGNSAIVEEIEQEKVGYFVQPSITDLAEKMKRFLTNEKKYVEYHKRALAYAKKFDTKKLLNEYLLGIISHEQ